MKKRTKKWSEVDAAALRMATKRYDAEFAADVESKPLTLLPLIRHEFDVEPPLQGVCDAVQH